MKLPRDVSGPQLVKALKVLGYLESRQSGSHIRLSTDVSGSHHVTVPQHDSLKLGTFKSILDDVAAHHNMTRDELLGRLDFDTDNSCRTYSSFRMRFGVYIYHLFHRHLCIDLCS
jgi:predicted RNA binding protein YcfA (HicA-like mRNA interferase family)